MTRTTIGKIVEMIREDVLSSFGDEEIISLDRDALDASIQRLMDSIETKVYNSTLAELNKKLEETRGITVEKWW